MVNSFSYTLEEPHDNQLPEAIYNDDAIYDDQSVQIRPPTISHHGLDCDGTVYVESTDAVCYADVHFNIDGTDYDQRIMNVPYQDAERLPLYIQYFLNDQDRQLSA